MKKYRIKYNEGDTINKTETFEAKCMLAAVIVFTMEKPDVLDISEVTEVTE